MEWRWRKRPGGRPPAAAASTGLVDWDRSGEPEAVAHRVAELEEIIGPAFRQADGLALAAQRRHRRFELLQILAALSAAMLGALQAAAPGARWPGLALAIPSSFAFFLELRHRRSQVFLTWIDARARAEELRALFFEALSGVRQSDTEGARRDLIARVEGIRVAERERPRPQSLAAEAAGDCPWPSGEAAYFEAYRRGRAEHQARWYRKRIATYEDRERSLARSFAALTWAATLCGIVGGIAISQAVWLGIVAAVCAGLAAAIAAWRAAVGLSETAESYKATLSALCGIPVPLSEGITPSDVASYASSVEDVLRSEGGAWSSTWSARARAENGR